MEQKKEDYIFEKDEIINLNVGGRLFRTYLSTLQKSEFENSLLGTMFNPRNKHLLKPNEKSEYFFDRSPDLFEYIINYYRTNELDIPISIPYKMFIKELDYFQMPHHSSTCNNNNYNFNTMNSFKLNLNPIQQQQHQQQLNLNSIQQQQQQQQQQQLNLNKSNLSPRLINNVLLSNLNNNSNNSSNGTNSGNNSNSNSCNISPRVVLNNENQCNINNNNESNQNNIIDNQNNNQNNQNATSLCTCNNMLLGERLKLLSLDKARKDGGDMLELIKIYCYETLIKAAEQGKQYEIIQFKSSDTEIEKFYSFISNLRNRELFLLDLMNDGFDVNFSEEFGRYYHSYLLQITFWSRYSTSSNVKKQIKLLYISSFQVFKMKQMIMS
ncbi:hypothetical protein DICPUDRAFT_157365 [Dictyostelium purpureum]|uniref:BTB domain-containing protein n=1 Tax=Dictyostelium purpureum TaxID=5786 RepID=F0ZYY4_DICPU|nr:uncharacterized protein DICPUDRAFT_157365 [Dictyostelium purpureum]EGC30843.1 hypothetical protein DICPUDRAFT_157365 [Dictyostelium purpureum]|eukprot:XP_003292632.1 hypothetical protein DICPUDRAFT_157365 [Dictyostelium purpureum]